MSFTIVQDQDVENFGVEVAYTLANIRSLPKSKDNTAIVSSAFLINLGVVKSKSSASRLLQKLESLGLITVCLKRVGGSFVNIVSLKEFVQEAAQEPTQEVATKQPDVETIAPITTPTTKQTAASVTTQTEDFAKKQFVSDGFYIDKTTQEVVIVQDGKRHLYPFWPRLTTNAKKQLLAKHSIDNVLV